MEAGGSVLSNSAPWCRPHRYHLRNCDRCRFRTASKPRKLIRPTTEKRTKHKYEHSKIGHWINVAQYICLDVHTVSCQLGRDFRRCASAPRPGPGNRG